MFSMSNDGVGGALRAAGRARVLALVAFVSLVQPSLARAASNFPDIPVWALAGAWLDSSLVRPNTCVGLFDGPFPDSVWKRPRTITVRFMRDRVTEARPDFGGYRIYRMTNTPDSSRAVLIRRFSLNPGSGLTWNFSRLDPATMRYRCPPITGPAVDDSIVTFVDPDSNGQYIKVCRRPADGTPRCFTPGDSIMILFPPPGPHDGFLTWYSITIERKNTTDPDYEDLFVPDTLDNFARCTNPLDRGTCPNLNHKLRNLAGPVEPTRGPTPNLERVLAVPNPYRGSEVWDTPGGGEVHFINLPQRSTIKIFTAAGDLVRELQHNDPVRDFERWDLNNGSGQRVASGIYVYRVESGSFHFQGRLVVIR